MTPHQKAALDRLLCVARADSNQSRVVANFLLAWWSSVEFGAFNLREFSLVDTDIALDMIEICRLIACADSYGETYGYDNKFTVIIKKWRPSIDWWEGLTELQKIAWNSRFKPFTIDDAYQEWLDAENQKHEPEGW
jgi:hypothetical protein